MQKEIVKNKNTEIFMAICVIVILLVMIIPLPPIMLDLFLALNITLSLVILLVGMYILKPIEFSAFPTILLLVTIFRLSLNIASTRIILLRGHEGMHAAGKVINSFGNFVVGGNYLVGLIVFIILVVINFMVITKGSGRIAEVAARFTLDAMPGKQMSIDADLNAGLITEEEAKSRRHEIAQESEYYGAMDGANKFVRGDAIAGIIITLINIIAGFAIGVFQNGMSFTNAAQNYTLLTIGDGLVTQVPALIVSTAAGIVVSRAGSEASLGKTITLQIFKQPRAIAFTSVLLLFFGMFPGMPTIPFFIISIITGIAAMMVISSHKKIKINEQTKIIPPESETFSETLSPLPPVDIIAMEIGYGLIPLVDAEQNGELVERIKSIRHQIAEDIGIIVPTVHIQDNMQLKSQGYSILLKGNEVASGEIMMNHLLALGKDENIQNLEGIPTVEPTYNLPALWIKEHAREDAMMKGYTVVDISTVIITHLSEVMKNYAHEYIGRQEVHQLIDNLKDYHPKLVEELIPNILPLGSVVKVIQNLLKEKIPIRDLLTILETLADKAILTKDIDLLTDFVRQALSRTITKLYLSQDGDLPVITLDETVENEISDAIQNSDQGKYLTIEPEKAQYIMSKISDYIEKFKQLNHQPIVMCSAQIRSHLKKLTERFIPNLVVLSYNEILSNITIQNMGTIRITNAN
jgi:flagellar biosynthesis protein FlhA